MIHESEAGKMGSRFKNYIVSIFLTLLMMVLPLGIRIWIISTAVWDEIVAIDLRSMAAGMLIAVIVIIISIVVKKRAVPFFFAVASLAISLPCSPVVFSALYLIGAILALASIPFIASRLAKIGPKV